MNEALRRREALSPYHFTIFAARCIHRRHTEGFGPMKDLLDALIEAVTARHIVSEDGNLAAINIFHEALENNFKQVIEFLKQRGMSEADAYELMSFTCWHEANMSKHYADYLRQLEKEHNP
jgi:hypothetical protein